jgi:hypothetical protein
VIGAIIEIGTNLNTLLVPVMAAVVVWMQSKSNKQFKPNGGATMRDAINRIEETVAKVAHRIDVLEDERKDREPEE